MVPDEQNIAMGEPLPTADMRTLPFTRRIAIAVGPGWIRATVADDFHHFQVAISHVAGRISDIPAETYRAPFSLCPSATTRLTELIGRAVGTDIFVLLLSIDARQQCTQQFDTALLALAVAQQGAAYRTYHVTVDQAENGKQLAMLERDGHDVLAWHVRDHMLIAPDIVAGVDMQSGFTAWGAHPPDGIVREDALVLRRAWFVAQKRMKPDRFANPAAPETGGCWVQWPGRAANARRIDSDMVMPAGKRPVTKDDRHWLLEPISEAVSREQCCLDGQT